MSSTLSRLASVISHAEYQFIRIQVPTSANPRQAVFEYVPVRLAEEEGGRLYLPIPGSPVREELGELFRDFPKGARLAAIPPAAGGKPEGYILLPVEEAGRRKYSVRLGGKKYSIIANYQQGEEFRLALVLEGDILPKAPEFAYSEWYLGQAEKSKPTGPARQPGKQSGSRNR